MVYEPPCIFIVDNNDNKMIIFVCPSGEFEHGKVKVRNKSKSKVFCKVKR